MFIEEDVLKMMFKVVVVKKYLLVLCSDVDIDDYIVYVDYYFLEIYG